MPEAVLRWVDVNVLGWLQARERKALRFTVVAQLVILVAMIGLRAIPLVTGQTVLVRVQPVDPRDLFRGDYVILSYDFSRASRDSIQGLAEREVRDSRKTEGRPVYVTLVPDSDRVHWRAGKYTLAKPDGGLFLKGQMGRYGSLQFGIESYFVQEGTGHRYERAIREHKLSAELAVTSSGQAALRSLRIE
jgi:uncharacterized membrane-anchored protein